ncbi:hypothetical protein LJC58_09995 [Lachnospiraceae bacterium OttesenSCG-928-D06]|nr:hypothetical protein [Lachnospiraceae bacterium OttesenSCG-928-D06]
MNQIEVKSIPLKIEGQGSASNYEGFGGSEPTLQQEHNDTYVTKQVADELLNFDPITEYILKKDSFFQQEIPELEIYSKHISESSQGEASIIIECDGIPKDVKDIDTSNNYQGMYYLVYVGEEWKDHRVNWDWFLVNEEFDEILWLYLPDSQAYFLSEWRNSSNYRDLDK